MSEKTKIAVVILNWNGKHFLDEFLPFVIDCSAAPGVEIWVADNASTDDSIDLLKKKFPEVKLLILSENFGFAEGYNRALQKIEATYYVLLNSDVEVTPGWIAPVIALMENDEDIAAVAPKLLMFDQRTVFEYAGAAGGFIDALGYPFCRGRIFDHVESDQGQYDDDAEVFWATGACMFVKSEVFHSLGGFDASFFAHMEEIDLCWRMKNRGYKIMYTSKSSVYHVGGGTLNKENAHKTFLNYRNNLFMLYKNLPQEHFLIKIIVRMILDGVSALKHLLSFQGSFFIAILKAHGHFYKNLPRLISVRKANRPFLHKRHKEMIPAVLIYQNFFLHKRTFNEIVKK